MWEAGGEEPAALSVSLVVVFGDGGDVVDGGGGLVAVVMPAWGGGVGGEPCSGGPVAGVVVVCFRHDMLRLCVGWSSVGVGGTRRVAYQLVGECST